MNASSVLHVMDSCDLWSDWGRGISSGSLAVLDALTVKFDNWCSHAHVFSLLIKGLKARKECMCG